MIKLPGKVALDLLYLPVQTAPKTEARSLGIDLSRELSGSVRLEEEDEHER